MRRAALALVLIASAARADNVWDHALQTGAPDVNHDLYDKEMADGDEYTQLANSRSSNTATVRHSLDLALVSYRNAAKAMPDAAEPYYRIGELIHSFVFECDFLQGWQPPTCNNEDLQKAREMVEAWDAFEARAPLDPRVTELLYPRAIARTKLVKGEPAKAKQYLMGALRDYEAAIDRWKYGIYARHYELAKDTLYGNLAETYMMVGRLDDAIDAYKEAINAGADTSVVYGLAVALDRDERSAQALNLIRSKNARSDYQQFMNKYVNHLVFYVPSGEEFYYFALIEEALGAYDASIQHWQQYIASGAHPQYQPRAKAHLDSLLAQKRLRPSLPSLDLFEDTP